MSWLDENQNHLLLCQNDVVLSFVERVNQGKGLVNWLKWLTEPPIVCWSVIMGDLSPGPKGIYCTRPEVFRRDHQAGLCKACKYWIGANNRTVVQLSLEQLELETPIGVIRYQSALWCPGAKQQSVSIHNTDEFEPSIVKIFSAW